MNQYPDTPYTDKSWIVLDIGNVVRDFTVSISDHLLHGKAMSSPREIVTWTWRYLMVTDRVEHIAEAVMVEACSYCDTRRIDTVRKIDSAVVRMCDELVLYCRQTGLYDCRYGLLYDLVAWIDNFTPIVVPIGTEPGLPPTSPLVLATGKNPRYKSVMSVLDFDHKLPF